MSGTRLVSPKAPATDRHLAGAALVICSHGGAADPAELTARAERLAAGGPFVAVAGAFLYGEPRLEAVIDGLADRDGLPPAAIHVVPLFMAEGITLAALEERLAGLDAAGRIRLCPPLGSHPRLAGLLAATAAEAMRARGWSPAETGLVLVGHGSRRSTASLEATRRLARGVARVLPVAEIETALLESGPGLARIVAAMRSRRILVQGCFAERGRHAMDDVPALIGESGRDMAYLGPLAAAPWLDRLILDQASCGLGDEPAVRQGEFLPCLSL